MGTKKMTLRLSPIHAAQLVKLSEKLQVDQANILRIAITRLAESEGIEQPAIKPTPKRR